MFGWFSAEAARASRRCRSTASVFSTRLGHELQSHVAAQARVLGLPDDTHAALADLFDQAVVRQLLAGFDRHARAVPSIIETPNLRPELDRRMLIIRVDNFLVEGN